MSQFNEVPEPIICNPYDEPAFHWFIEEGKPCVKLAGRRPAVYYYRPPGKSTGVGIASEIGVPHSLDLVNEIRERVKAWREEGYPGIGRTTFELLQYWKRDGRKRFFFCQHEAVETIIFLVEGRADLKQGLEIPREVIPEYTRFPNGSGNGEYRGFIRYACKMATGTGKTMVMGLLAAWSILNKVNDRTDSRFSDVIFVVCPNITITERLAELDPNLGDASIYRVWDIVPPHLMDKMRTGKVIISNWHKLEARDKNQVGGVGAKVVAIGKVSDRALVRDVFGKSVSGKQNILIFNDEAHHAYRLFQEKPDDWDELSAEEREEWEEGVKEATVWIDGLDRINRTMGINFCLDLSATPYFLNRTGQEANTPFPWIVSDFSLVDSIESGLVKIPQLPVRDTTGKEIAAYFNVWNWIIKEKLTPAERGGRREQPKPEAILKYAYTPIAQLAGLWQQDFQRWSRESARYPSPPVFIIVCRNIKLAKTIYEWIADDVCPRNISSLGIPELRNTDTQANTIRVDSKVIFETDVETSKDIEKTRMRFVLDTVGKTEWPGKRPPTRWVELAEKLNLPINIPPGRDVKCVISVAMLTEGWDCRTVTHIVGLRPFMSQLLCEQVVGRGLRRTVYDPKEDGLMSEEVSKVYGVPFEIIPYKTNPQGPVNVTPKIWHIKAVIPEKDRYEIRYPRVEGYSFAIRNRIKVDWDSVPRLVLDPSEIPPEVEVKGLSTTNGGRISLYGPGKTDEVTLREWRMSNRLQALKFDMAKNLTLEYSKNPQCEVPPQELFKQILNVIDRFLEEKVVVPTGQDIKDAFIPPYYGLAIERLIQQIRPDTDQGEAPELPLYERNRPSGSTREVDFWTSRPVREIMKSHLNYVVADTARWEQSVAYYLDRHPNVEAFAKNSGLGFGIPYLHNGEPHDYIPDFLVRLRYKDNSIGTVILECKGFDPLADVKRAAARRWVAAVNAEGSYGNWDYKIVREPVRTTEVINGCVEGWV